jgi:hypothetical protein
MASAYTLDIIGQPHGAANPGLIGRTALVQVFLQKVKACPFAESY